MTPALDIRRVGTDPKRTALSLDDAPIMLTGLEEWPKVGERP